MALVFELPLFVVGLTRIGIITTDQLRKNRRIGYFLVACVARRAARASTRSRRRLRDAAARDPLRVLDLALRRCSTAARARTTATAASRRDGGLRRLGAPGRRPAAARTPSSPGRTGASSRSARAAPTATRGRGDPPGPRQRALAPRVRGLCRVRRRPALRRRGSARTSRASARSPTTRWSRSRGAAPPTRSPPGSRPRPTTASRAPPPPPRPSSACARSSTSRSSAPSPRRRAAVRRSCAPRRRDASSSASASRRTRRTPARVDVYRWCLSLGIPVGTHLAESANENDWLEHGTGRWPSNARRLVPPTGKRAVATLADVLGPELLCAHCVQVDADEIALLAATTSRSRTARARTRCSAAGSRRSPSCGPPALRVGLGTDSPASTPSFDPWEELRTAVYASRARERRPDALAAHDALRLATLDAARALGLDDEIGSLTPGKRADLTVLSLAGSPYDPVEDPAVGAVFGGSPAGVSRRSSTEKPATAKERPRGKRYAAPQAPPAGECSP